MKISASKIILVTLILVLLGGFFYLDLQSYFSFDYIKSQQAAFSDYYSQNTVSTIGIYLAVYIVSTALSLPGATILTLLAGALFELGLGTVLVSIASTSGATLAFLFARFLLRDSIQSKFGDRIKVINDGVEKEGAFYLFTLRLVPIFPFFMINLVMGLTPIRTLTFFFVSQVGMLPGTMVYVNAGTQLAQLESMKGILSPQLLFSFALLGVFPLLAKKVVAYIKKKRGVTNV